MGQQLSVRTKRKRRKLYHARKRAAVRAIIAAK